jgi:hypothetical protein
MNLPTLLADVNAELRRRGAAGLSVRVVNYRPEVLADDEMGLFLRVHCEMDDGDTFSKDTLECVALLIRAADAAAQHARPH